MTAARRTDARIRAGISIGAGLIAGVAAGLSAGPIVGVLSGWTTFAAINVVWIVLMARRMDAAATRAHATAEDPGRGVARIVSVAGSLISLVAVGVVLLQSRDATGAEETLLAALAVLSVVASWGLIQVDYLLRYARMYYSDPVGGIDFNQEEDPEYTDFAYFSLGLGMTYQVADTDVTTNGIRRLVIAQTLLAYLFGAVILGTIINVIAGLG
ncbi:DUF1345 domain-containing protein [Microbacterium sp.]|uniref:DUF1345 domain-containing protein n=1 Tax=Microbacterium sp. TaxID=51671 RepID=UPI0039E40CCF